jgi:hypothetical protein
MRKVSLPSGESLTVSPILSVQCICGVRVQIGIFGLRGEPVALHPLPQCDLFRKSDLLTYLQTLRKFYEPS